MLATRAMATVGGKSFLTITSMAPDEPRLPRTSVAIASTFQSEPPADGAAPIDTVRVVRLVVPANSKRWNSWPSSSTTSDSTPVGSKTETLSVNTPPSTTLAPVDRSRVTAGPLSGTQVAFAGAENADRRLSPGPASCASATK